MAPEIQAGIAAPVDRGVQRFKTITDFFERLLPWSTVGSVGADQYAFTDAGIDPTKSYTYRIAAIDLSGAKIYSPEAEIGPDASVNFTLGQNYPNPASGLTAIRFTVPVNTMITLRILDVTGKVISTEISNEAIQAGEQTYTFDASKFASSSYIYELTAV